MSDRWKKDEVQEDKVILQDWWKQQSHRRQLYAFTVHWLWTINQLKSGTQTQFSSGWTMLNIHDVVLISGSSAAYALGAPYPFKGDKEYERLFKLYLAMSHLSRMRDEERNGFFVRAHRAPLPILYLFLGLLFFRRPWAHGYTTPALC